MRIDTESLRYCTDDCTRVFDIKRVTPARITLIDEQAPVSEQFFVDRSDGKAFYFFEQSRWEGLCDRKVFSGLPKAKI